MNSPELDSQTVVMSESPHKSKRRILFIAGGILVLFIVCLVLFVFVLRKHHNASEVSKSGAKAIDQSAAQLISEHKVAQAQKLITESGKTDTTTMIISATLSEGQNHYKQALSTLQKAATENGMTPSLALNLGQAEYALNDKKAAVSYYQQALVLLQGPDGSTESNPQQTIANTQELIQALQAQQ